MLTINYEKILSTLWKYSDDSNNSNGTWSGNTSNVNGRVHQLDFKKSNDFISIKDICRSTKIDPVTKSEIKDTQTVYDIEFERISKDDFSKNFKLTKFVENSVPMNPTQEQLDKVLFNIRMRYRAINNMNLDVSFNNGKKKLNII